jgi:hypothetical protein
MRSAKIVGLTLALAATTAVWGETVSACAPPPGFRDGPHPVIAPAEQLVSHSEEIMINRPLAVVSKAMAKPLNQAIHQSDSLPGVSGDYMLTPGVFGTPGSRHIVCLTDGGRVEEQALEREENDSSGRFRYIVWNYQTPKARPIAYGVGEFRSLQIGGSHTRVTWTYSFRLKEDVFPGDLGVLGRFLFRAGFLDRDYAEMMRGVLNGYKSTAENSPGNAATTRGQGELR